jgi:hypothetical protein
MPSYGGETETLVSPTQRLRVILGLIWIKLTAYIRNDVNKVIASYSNGCRLLQQALDS